MSPPVAQSPTAAQTAPFRHDWTRQKLRALFDLPLTERIFRAQSVHRQLFDPAAVQISTLLSIKTGGCPEDCIEPACAQNGSSRSKRCSPKHAPCARAVPAGSAWVQRGARRRIAISIPFAPWSKASGRRGSKPVPRSACSLPPRRAGSKMRASTITTTISTARPNLRSSPYAPTRIAWKRSHMCGRPAFMFAAATLSAWAKRARTVAA